MNSFSSVTISIAVALLLIVSPTFTFGLASKKPCNLTIEYRIVDIVNVSKFLVCYPCDECEAGKEPLYPCGTDVRDNVTLGHNCKTCRAGTYSMEKDSHPCQDCPDPKCAKHEMIICNRKTGHNAHCTGKCKDGHVWDKKECIILLTTKAGTKKSTTKKSGDSEMHNATTKPDKEHTPNTMPDQERTPSTTKKPILEVIKAHHNQMPTDKILAIIFGCIGSLALIFACWHLIKRFRQRKAQVNQNHVNKCLPGGILPEESLSSSSESLMVETNKFIKKEKISQQNCQPAGNLPHWQPETPDDVLGIANSTAVDFTNENNTSGINVCSVPSTRGQLIELETHVKSPTHVQHQAAPGMPDPDILQTRPPPTAPPPQEAQRYIPRNRDPMHFDNLPSRLYTKICKTFDHGPPGKNSDALADELNCFSTEEARYLQGNANAIIQSWISTHGNNVPKFVQVLISKKLGMTDLADTLNDYINQVQLM